VSTSSTSGSLAGTGAIVVTPGPHDLSKSTVSVTPEAVSVGGLVAVKLTVRDAQGDQETSGGLPDVQFELGAGSVGGGSFAPTVDNQDGTYTALFTAGPLAGLDNLTATIGGKPLTSSPASLVIVAPTVSTSSATVASSATSLTIDGNGFDTNPANDTVTFDNGVIGTVTSASLTSLTVSVSGLGSLVGGTALHASVNVNGVSSGSSVQIATVAPVVTSSSDSLAATATSLTLSGAGFDTKPANDTVTFDNGVTGTVTSASINTLVVKVSGLGSLVAGTALHASVKVNGVSSGSPVQVATIITATEEFVDAAYVDVLHRHADPSSLATWVKLLDKGVVTRLQFANTLTHSAEYYSNFITSFYLTYLGRSPDPAGLKAWVQAMLNGLSDEHLEAGFIGSPEYIANHGGQGAGWVTGMYEDLLERTPSPSEVARWVNALNHGLSPQQVAYDFAAGVEAKGLRITADYLIYLNRTPTPAEGAVWVNAFENGYSNEDLVAAFVGSSEYYQKHTQT
jgi:hypothetical protein